MNKEIVKFVVDDIVRKVVLTVGIAAVIGIFVGLYFLDHYRWGGCK